MNLLKRGKVDATSGSIWKGIVVYAIPLVIATLIQTCFNAIDLIVLGNMADSSAVASVGATSTIVALMVNAFIGIANGSKIVLSHQFGAKNRKQIKETVDTCMLTALAMGVGVAIIGVFLAPSMLDWTHCPAECYEGAVIYLRIYVVAIPAILLYNFGSAVLTSSGDSQRPLLFITVSGLFKVILNICLCLVVSQKVIAVAVATVASQLLSAGLVIHRLCKMEGEGRLELNRMSFKWYAFRQIMAQGLPLGLNSSLYPLANVQIQSAINSFGVSAIAGNSAATTVAGIPDAFNSAIASTATVFMGQNLGAGKKDRVRQSLRNCLVANVTMGLILGTGTFLTGRFWLSLILPGDSMGVEYGLIRMFFIVLFYPVANVNGVLAAAIQTHGYAVYTSLASIICVIVFRMIWMFAVYPSFETFPMLMVCFTISWSLLMFSYIFGYFKFVHRNMGTARTI